MDGYSFTDCHGSFTMDNPNTNYLYFPLASERGLKSAITPDGGGDAKINQTSFLLEPESVENLHNNRGVRNFWVRVRDAGVFSALGASDMQQARKFTPEEETVTLSAGFMWHSVRRTVKDYGVESTVTTFIPWDSNVEIMAVTLRNASDGARSAHRWKTPNSTGSKRSTCPSRREAGTLIIS